MDYLKYVESHSLKDYWGKVGYNPDPMAMVYLITYNSDVNILLEERQNDLYQLASEYGEYSLKRYNKFVHAEKFSDFVCELTEMQEKMTNLFFSSKNPGEYSAKIYQRGFRKPFEFENGKLVDIYKHADSLDVDYIIAENYIPAGKYKDEDYYLRVKLNSNCEMVEILGGSGTSDEDDILHGFMSIYHDFPHPFKIGDYVRCILPSDDELGVTDIYKVIDLPKSRTRLAKDDNIADNFMNMSMILMNKNGEKAYIHVHDLELLKPGVQE